MIHFILFISFNEYFYKLLLGATLGLPNSGLHTTFELRRPNSVALFQSIVATWFFVLAVSKQCDRIQNTSKFIVLELDEWLTSS